MFPFTDEEQTDPITGVRDGLLVRARRSGTVPKFFHLLTNSEYFNRAGSLTHTDVTGTRDHLLAVTGTAPGVLATPEPKVHVTAVDPDRVTTLVQFWHAPSEGTAVVSSVITALAGSLDATMTAVSPRPMAPFTPPPRL